MPINHKKTPGVHDARLLQLLAEVEGSGTGDGDSRTSTQDSARMASFFIRWSVFGCLCLAIGFWTGRYNAQLQRSLPPATNRQLLTSQGWQHDGSGVFYRWCRGASCHTPHLYGGGLIQLFEVNCLERPCGEIRMQFNVLNAKGEIIDELSLNETGIQGEIRRFLIESQNAEATALELRQFSARARV